MFKKINKNQLVLLLLLIFVFACQKVNNEIFIGKLKAPTQAERDTSSRDDVLITPDEVIKNTDYEFNEPHPEWGDYIPSDLGDFGPFPIGSTWKYKYEEFFFNDQTYETDSSIYYYQVKVIKDTLIDGRQFFKTIRTRDGQVNLYYKMFYHTKNGEYFRAYKNSYNNDKIIVEKYLDTNLELAEEWRTDDILSGIHPVFGQVKSSKRIVYRKKGLNLDVENLQYQDVIEMSECTTFDFSNYSCNSPILRYYAKDIGFIYQDELRFNWTVENSLVEYDIK